jgi:hypothetical protein
METASTLASAEVAAAMVAHGVAKHRMRLDRVFLKAVRAPTPPARAPVLTPARQVLAGVML